MGLPNGLNFSSGGVLSGTPANQGSYSPQFTVADSANTTLNATLSLTVEPPPQTLLTVAPLQLSFAYTQGDSHLPLPQNIGVLSNPAGTGVTMTSTTSDGGNWLTVQTTFGDGSTTPGTIVVSVSPQSLAPNEYSGQVTINAPTATPSSLTVNITFVVRNVPQQLSVTSSLQSFALTQGGQAVEGQVGVANTGGGTLQYSAQASSDANWLALLGAASGVVTPSNPVALAFSVTPAASVSVGLHRGQITVTDGTGNQQTVNLTLLVNASQQSMQLSQSGFTFDAVVGGAAPPTQSFAVFNLGQGAMNWTTQTATIPHSQTWLRVAPVNGVSTPGAAGQVTVSVDPTGLAAGQYYGSVNVLAPTAVNAPQGISVLFNVVQAGQLGSAPQVSTAGVVLTGGVGSSVVSSQTVNLFNPAGTGLSYNTGVFTQDGGNWLTVAPATGSLSSVGTGKISIQVSPAGAAGVRHGTVRVAFSEGTVHTIEVASITSGGLSGSARSDVLSSAAVTGCTATQLVPVFLALEQGQTVQVAQPKNVQVQVVDDCQVPLTGTAGGTVAVSFSTGSTVSLADVGGGIWTGTWNPVGAASQASANTHASLPALPNAPALTGLGQLTGLQVLPANATAAAQPFGAFNAASEDVNNWSVVVPGAYVAIKGARLADSTALTGVPLPFTLGNTQVFLGNQPLPLYYASPAQVNALIPQELTVNTAVQLFVQRGNTGSVPVPVTVAELQPGIFTVDSTGQGQGSIRVAGPELLAASPASATQRPVQRGEYIEIYATGLGPVLGTNGEAPPADGVVTPASGNPQYKTVNPVSVSIGGVVVPAAFAGLAPGNVALYQIDAQVPQSVVPGDAVPVTLTVTGSHGAVSSQTVTIAVE
jgi:uncharacterized protein (TIGR03437 family)